MSAPREQDPDCLFCKIVRRERQAKVLFETDHVLAFEDVNPQAPVHVLVIPKIHIASLDDAPESSEKLLGEVLIAARRAAHEKGIAGDGYRIVLLSLIHI